MPAETIDATLVDKPSEKCPRCKKRATKLVRVNPNFSKGGKEPSTHRICRTCSGKKKAKA